MRYTLIIAILTLFLSCTEKDKKTGYSLVYQQNFDQQEAINDFEFSNPEKWKWNDGLLECMGRGDYKPPFRSPFIVSRIKDIEVSDFVFEADLKQTGREYGHRDMCIFFNYKDNKHFYYCHIATKPDNHAHNIFIVNEAARVKIAEHVSSGVNWGNNWHRMRLERNTKTGDIALYFDDMETPIMKANDKTFTTGQVGIGSFDDQGAIDNIRLFSH
ncbi:hypothetical protein EMN47_07960 [Prolixibacteraceae bacterium JC049]|nr:hypothetical protein [Prolixibacteraceae bacterium JC049]